METVRLLVREHDPGVEIWGEGQPGELRMLKLRGDPAVAVEFPDHHDNQDPESDDVDQRQHGQVIAEEEQAPAEIRRKLEEE